jgi:hypothetical protein
MRCTAAAPASTAHGGPHEPLTPHPRTRWPSPARFESAGELTRTALCVEVRDPQRGNGPKAEREAERQHGGKRSVLYVFMPPLRIWRTTSSCWRRWKPPASNAA